MYIVHTIKYKYAVHIYIRTCIYKYLSMYTCVQINIFTNANTHTRTQPHTHALNTYTHLSNS